MTHVVTDHCEGCRFTECLGVCPVECFRGDAGRLYIDPDLCIDSGACVPQCPVKAIVDSVDLDDASKDWIGINRVKARALPPVVDKVAPLPGAQARRQALGYA